MNESIIEYEEEEENDLDVNKTENKTVLPPEFYGWEKD